MAGRHSRRKGSSYEREVCDAIALRTGRKVRRKLGQARESGNDIDLPPYRIECKRRKTLTTVMKWFAQCAKDAAPGEVPIIVAREDNSTSIVIMHLDDFLKLIDPRSTE